MQYSLLTPVLSQWGYPQDKEKQVLILTRRVGETLKIGADGDVTVLGVHGNQVRVGINAPKNVAVHREEVFERIQRESAAGSEPAQRELSAAAVDGTA